MEIALSRWFKTESLWKSNTSASTWWERERAGGGGRNPTFISDVRTVNCDIQTCIGTDQWEPPLGMIVRII